jgi:superfamily II DNA or RNA helicase
MYSQRICPALRALQITRVTPRICTIRQFHSSPFTLVENVEKEVSAPRKRGRPKKIKTEETAVEVAEVNTNISTEVKPVSKPTKSRKAPKISDITRLIPPSAIQPSPTRSLRPYQEECVEACLSAISEGKRRLGISLATGAGKTVIFTNLIGKVQLEDTKRYQTIILVHRRELVEQAARHCVEVYPDKVLYPTQLELT